jgi:hypothetical protein
MDDGELVSRVRRPHESRERFTADRGDRPAELLTVLGDDLDVVGPLGDPRGDERLGLSGRVDRRNLHAVLGAMSAGRRGERAGRNEVGTVPRAPGRLLGAHPGGELVVGEHVELGRDAKDGRLAQVLGRERVRVCVDQPGQQGLPLPVDDLRSFRCR